MKKHRIEEKTEIILSDGHPRRLIGPRNKLRLVRNLLTEMDFKPATEDLHPWRKVAKEKIDKYGEPALMLRGAREREGLTQAELARRLGTHQSNIANMENGSRSIGKATAQKLAKVLGVDFRVFL